MIALDSNTSDALKACKNDLMDLEFLLGRLAAEANRLSRDLRNFNYRKNYGLTLNLMQSQLDAIRDQVEVCRESDQVLCNLETLEA
jgi:hypothetical protein